jgi:hypothetical protein
MPFEMSLFEADILSLVLPYLPTYTYPSTSLSHHYSDMAFQEWQLSTYLVEQTNISEVIYYLAVSLSIQCPSNRLRTVIIIISTRIQKMSLATLPFSTMSVSRLVTSASRPSVLQH